MQYRSNEAPDAVPMGRPSASITTQSMNYSAEVTT